MTANGDLISPTARSGKTSLRRHHVRAARRGSDRSRRARPRAYRPAHHRREFPVCRPNLSADVIDVRAASSCSLDSGTAGDFGGITYFPRGRLHQAFNISVQTPSFRRPGWPGRRRTCAHKSAGTGAVALAQRRPSSGDAHPISHQTSLPQSRASRRLPSTGETMWRGRSKRLRSYAVIIILAVDISGLLRPHQCQISRSVSPVLAPPVSSSA